MCLSRRIATRGMSEAERAQILTREWLVTNGLGGYASGTIGGLPRRRYHGLLVAALPAPLGRRLVFPHLGQHLRTPDGTLVSMTAPLRKPDSTEPQGGDCLEAFLLDLGLPVWRYRIGDLVIERQLLLSHRQNTMLMRWRMIEGDTKARLTLLVALHHRSHNDPVDTPLPGRFEVSENENRYEFTIADLPPIRMTANGRRAAFALEQGRTEMTYPIEASRGFEDCGSLWTPGIFHLDLTRDHPAALRVSTEPWETVMALTPEEMFAAEYERRRRCIEAAVPGARSGITGELTLAADAFLVQPQGRAADAARAHAEGNEVRSIIAGYPWFTDWGRDAMISLEGLTLVTGRHAEAREILHLFGHYIRDGLLPNLFPEGETEGLYHTADATLWFFHAVERYVRASGDQDTLDQLLPKLLEVAEHHVRGTRFGIGVDAGDGLLRQGEAGYQLTWMDAKVEDWVVTPRRGKAVEINALWYNALRLLSGWLRRRSQGAAAQYWEQQAEQVHTAFNRRFWFEAGGYLYDVVDTGQGEDDTSCRPNQLLAIALDHPVLDPRHWAAVLKVVRERLWTPVGLRSLASDHPDYQPRYYGDRRARDAAYHQGTVWPWLMGPFIDAWLRLHPGDVDSARRFLAGLDAHLDEECVGSISEIFDAEPPFTPRGCIAQAWSIAEVLRCRLKLQR